MQWWKKQESPCFSCGECQCHEIDINKIVVIPSSIHEMLFLPWDEEIDERYMDEMIQELNDTLVSPIEQLGNKSYIMEV